MAAEVSARYSVLSHPAERSRAAASRWSRGPWLVQSLVLLDLVALAVAFGVAYLTRFTTGLPLLSTPDHSVAFYSSVAFWAVPLWIGIFATYRLYDGRHLFEGFQEYIRVANACTTGLVAIVLVSFLYRELAISRGWLLLTWLLAIVSVCSGRFLQRRVLRSLRRRGKFVTPTVIVGTNEEATALAEQMLHDVGCGLQVAGFVSTSHEPASTLPESLPVLGRLENLDEIIRQVGARELIVASTAVSRDQLLDLYRTVGQDEDVELRLSSGLFEILTTGVHVQQFNGVPLMTPHRQRITGVDAFLKRSMDCLLSAGALVVLGPVLLLLIALVKLDSPGPAIHRRRVLGVGGKRFDAFKLRTMQVNAERRQRRIDGPFPDRRQTLKGERDPRITRFGHLLRRTSLDELPQLINVLRGEMSLIGPRMIAPDEAERYGKWQHNLLTVRPGISGPWQVQGRSDIPYDERVRLSMQYVRGYSFWLDLEILFRTIYVVFKGKGAY